MNSKLGFIVWGVKKHRMGRSQVAVDSYLINELLQLNKLILSNNGTPNSHGEHEKKWFRSINSIVLRDIVTSCSCSEYLSLLLTPNRNLINTITI